MTARNRRTLLYLDTRALPIERNAEMAAALGQGHDIVMASPTPSVYNSFGLMHNLHVPVGDYDAAEDMILHYLQRHGIEIQGILCWKDREVELAARLNEHLGLPATPVSAALNVRDKSRTRKVISGLGDYNPRYKIVRDEASFLRGLQSIGTPCLLKPAGNSGGRGILRIDSSDEAPKAYREFVLYNERQSDDMFRYYSNVALLEEVLVGSEHSVAGVVADGQVVVFAIADKKVDSEVPIQFQNVVPTNLSQQMRATIVDLTLRVVEDIGLDWTGFHLDLMVTADGPKILEVGGRLGGECINSHLIPLSVPGLNPYRSLLEVVQGRNPFRKTDFTDAATCTAAMRILRPTSTGRIEYVAGQQNVWRHPATREFIQLRGASDLMRLPRDEFKSFEIGYLIAQCAVEDDIDAVLDEIASNVEWRLAQ